MTDGPVNRHGTRPFLVMAALGLGLALGGCQTDGTGFASSGSRTLAFESIDGPPRPTFEKLVGHLTTEAEAQKVAVVSRSEPASYRVRGYLAVNSSRDKTAVAYVWDVFDASKQRVARVSGEEVVKRAKGDAWAACDEAVLTKIAGISMASLAETIGVPVAGATPQTAKPAETAAAPAEAPAPQEPAPRAPALSADEVPVAQTAASPLAYAQQ
ncbi:hypothetical protein [Aquabacter spiritensis]|uniref:Lipoprotein n=1 Tax=Aquabacter spiritensis TaxID=933073 RepID=A0A4R3M4J5_9HYPH|nr:hypothetical protein [Aquabacter spiritensis]TCT08231.1 hypothetical protein EDC64_101753 [Aquabacter spiritensis]